MLSRVGAWKERECHMNARRDTQTDSSDDIEGSLQEDNINTCTATILVRSSQYQTKFTDARSRRVQRIVVTVTITVCNNRQLGVTVTIRGFAVTKFGEKRDNYGSGWVGGSRSHL